jgi:hypothetical protein
MVFKSKHLKQVRWAPIYKVRHMENARQIINITTARNAILVPFSSSEQEKIQAITLLSQESDDDSIQVLKRALHMIKEPLSAQRTLALASPIRGGLVASHAGTALALSKNLSGLEYLIKIALAVDSATIVREVAIKSLTFSKDRIAVEAVAHLLYDRDASIVRAALEATETLLKNGIKHTDLANQLISAAYSLALTQTSKSIPQYIRSQAYTVLITHANDEAMTHLVKMILSTKSIVETHPYLQAILDVSPVISAPYLAQLLTKILPDSSWYFVIAERLLSHKNATTEKVARKIIQKNSLGMRLRATLNPSFFKMVTAQKQAARLLLAS